MITVEVTSQELFDAMQKMTFTSTHFPATAESVVAATEHVQNIWSEYLVKKNKNPQKANFKINKTGDFSAAVSTDNKDISAIQTGKPAVDYDMKQIHPYGKKSRVSKKGVPYLIINFRWGTEKKRARWSNYIPQKYLRTSVKALDVMRITGIMHDELNAKGQAIPRNEYENTNPNAEKKWDSLSEDDAWEVTSKSGKTHSSKGLVHMSSGEYFTFRIISAKSPKDSWLYHRDAVPGVDMIGEVEKLARPGVEKIVEQALLQDIESIFQNK